MALPTHGTMAVDWEQRIDFDRLRTERLARVKGLLAKSEMGALLCFDMNNVRYLTATHIGTWAQDKANRFSLLPQNDEPILWDFGSAARHHQLHCPWLGERSRPGISMLRGAMSPEMGRAEDVAKKIRIELEKRGLHMEPLGIDIIEPPVLFALQREGIKVVDGQPLMSDAREIKTQDEISLLNMSAMMVDAAYDELYRAMKPVFPGSVAIRTRMCFPIACSGRAIPCTTTFSTLTWDIALATTAVSPSATRHTPWWMPTNAAANTWTPRFRSCGPGALPQKSPLSGPKRRNLGSRMRRRASRCSTGTASAWRFGKSR